MSATKRVAILAFASVVLLAPARAHATVLTFDGLGLANQGIIPAAYGDNVNPLCTSSGCCNAVGCYGMGNGFTPNVTVEYRAVRPLTGAVALNSLSFWTTDYGDLKNVAYAGVRDHLAEIALVPAPGFEVILNGFDLGGWPKSDVADQVVRVIGADGTVLLDFSPVKVRGVNDHTRIAPGRPLVSGGTLRIQFGPSWLVGIDNVNFDQAPAGTYEGCHLDAACQENLDVTASALLACEDDLATCQEEVAVLNAQLASVRAELAAATKDSDRDGKRDLDDSCPNTALAAAIDSAGCSQAQFCATVWPGTKSNATMCTKLDWKNDEPLMGSGQQDCKVDTLGTRTTSDDRCVPTS
jgi:hypothetical protein